MTPSLNPAMMVTASSSMVVGAQRMLEPPDEKSLWHSNCLSGRLYTRTEPEVRGGIKMLIVKLLIAHKIILSSTDHFAI